MQRWIRTGLVVAFVAVAVGWFALGTVLMDEVPRQWIVAAAALAAAACAFASSFGSKLDAFSLTRRDLALAALAGVGMVYVTPTIVFANRFSDAPPGSEVLFFTTASWALLGAVASLLTRRGSLASLAFAAAGVLGSAALLANWERPSSFSPFIRYPEQELWFLVAGMVWVAGTLVLGRIPEGTQRRKAVLVSASAGAVVATVAALFATESSDYSKLSGDVAPLITAGVFFGVLFLIWVHLAYSIGPSRPGALWFLVPVGMTALGVFEQALSPRGPDPIVWVGAIGGSAIALTGAAGLWVTRCDAAQPTAPTDAPALLRAATAVAWLTVLGAVVTLVIPAFQASVKGTLSSGQGYAATWAMFGFESAGGWSPLVAGGLLLSGVMCLGSRRRYEPVLAGVSSALVVATYPLIAATPLHTWNRWVPAEIQSEYGTEYALLSFTAVHHPLRLATLALASAGAVLVLVLAMRPGRGSARAETSSEVE